MSVKIISKQMNSRIEPIPIGVRYMCRETIRHQQLIRARKLTDTPPQDLNPKVRGN